jgi:hypothetical protein
MRLETHYQDGLSYFSTNKVTNLVTDHDVKNYGGGSGTFDDSHNILHISAYLKSDNTNTVYYCGVDTTDSPE